MLYSNWQISYVFIDFDVERVVTGSFMFDFLSCQAALGQFENV